MALSAPARTIAAVTRLLPWLLLLATLGAGCSRPTRVALAARDQILLVGNGAEPKDLDSQTFVTSNELRIESALFESLVNLANDGRTLLPGVAESWEVSPDGRIYTFHLRSGARWSDGSPLTAEDLLYSYRRYFAPTLANVNAVYGYAIAGSREYNTGKNPSPASVGVRIVDPQTFEIRLADRSPTFLSILATMYPVPRTVVERFGGGQRTGTAWTQPGHLVGNGAFVLRAWRPGQDLVVERNPRYWDAARVRLREIHFLPTDNPEAEERSYRSGELHTTYALPVSKLAVYRDQAGGPLHVSPQLHTNYLVFHTTQPPFTDARVRRAFSLALDRDRLIPQVLHEAGSPAHTLARPGSAGYAPAPPLDYDPAQARALLAAAGYPGGRGFPAVEFAFYPGRAREVMEALQQVWLRELGVRVSLATQEKNVLFDRMSAHNFTAAEMGYFYAEDAPEAMLLMALSDSGYNYAQWHSPAYDRAYAAAIHAGTAADYQAALGAMDRLLQAEVPYAPLFYVNQCFLVSPQVRGWRDNALGQIDWRELSLEP